MQVSVETTQGLERKITITVPADKVESEVKNRLVRLSKTQRLDGFRPGKVPVSVIARRFGQSVRQDVASDMAQRNYVEAIIQEKINPAGAPQLEILKNEAGQDFEFTATIEVYPEFEVQGVDALEIEKATADVTDADLDNMLDTLRKQQASWSEVEREVRDGDKVNIDFEGKVDGELFDGGKAEGFDLEIGAGRMIPGFEDPILGRKAGEEVVVNVTFPEDYHAENLKGKDAEFAVKINKVEERVLPEVNEEFAKNFGVGDGSVESLKGEVRNNMKRELKQALKNQVKEKALDALLEKNEVEVPNTLLDQEIDNLRKQAQQRFGANEQNQSLPELPAELFAEQASKRVKVGLVLGEFIKSNELKPDENRVKQLIEEIASAYEDPTEVLNYYMKNEEMLQKIRNVALEEQAIDLILEKAKVTEVAKGFEEVMNPQRQA
jgi:trigger factor